MVEIALVALVVAALLGVLLGLSALVGTAVALVLVLGVLAGPAGMTVKAVGGGLTAAVTASRVVQEEPVVRVVPLAAEVPEAPAGAGVPGVQAVPGGAVPLPVPVALGGLQGGSAVLGVLVKALGGRGAATVPAGAGAVLGTGVPVRALATSVLGAGRVLGGRRSLGAGLDETSVVPIGELHGTIAGAAGVLGATIAGARVGRGVLRGAGTRGIRVVSRGMSAVVRVGRGGTSVMRGVDTRGRHGGPARELRGMSVGVAGVLGGMSAGRGATTVVVSADSGVGRAVAFVGPEGTSGGPAKRRLGRGGMIR